MPCPRPRVACAHANETPDVKVAGIVAYAPAWAYLDYVESIQLAGVSVAGLRPALATILYADLANAGDDESQAGAAFAPSVRDYISKAAGTLCFDKLGPALDSPATGYVPPMTIGEFVDPDFKAGAVDCAKNGKCSGLPGAWVARSKANDPHVDPSVPILYLQGDADTAVKPALASCFFGRLVKDGADPVECVYPGESHESLIPTSAGFAVDWALATAAGKTPPACPVDGALPNCSPF